MPISYEIDSGNGIVVVTFRGKASVSEIRDFRSKLTRDPNFSQKYDQLLDTRELSPDFTRADVRRLADVISLDELGVTSRRAVVMNSGELIQLMEVFQAYTKGRAAEYRTFRSIEEAREWLAS